MTNADNIFGPPDQPTEAQCLHCRRIFMSDLMVPIEIDGQMHWMCPVPGCGAMGFGIDIFPTDPSHPESGIVEDDDDLYLDLEEEDGLECDGQFIADEVARAAEDFDPPTEWTPESDMEDDEADDWFRDDAEIGLDDGVSSEVTHPDLYFTREDFDKAKSDGIYDRAAEETRRRWRETKLDTPFDEGDIPF